MHGFNSIMLKDKDGNPAPVYSIGSGIDYLVLDQNMLI